MQFVIRPAEPSDEGFIVGTWLYSYARSKYGATIGASVPNNCEEKPQTDPEKWANYWKTHKPIVERLTKNQTVNVACDANYPDILYGFECHTGDVLHYVLCKWQIHNNSAERDTRGIWCETTGISGRIYRELLKEFLPRPTGYTHELVDMNRPHLRAQGLTIPSAWYVDSTYFERAKHED